MRRRIVLVSVVFFVVLMVQPIHVASEDSPLFLRHTLISYQQNADLVSLDYNLIVENTGEAPIYNLTLSQVPLSFITSEEVTLTIGDLPGGGSAEVSFQLSTPMVLNEEEFCQHPLFWTGEYQDEVGLGHDVPLESYSDGMPPQGEGGAP